MSGAGIGRLLRGIGGIRIGVGVRIDVRVEGWVDVRIDVENGRSLA
ncbi:hypothetical protein KCH_09780 [Kitasatospora cheerisanensis KCTC 2395]|uniref:Uncharacterized protein n=1 Tax=Kitasatospora cheerisanensis KCTC 2395 TaxID=1348663 RepID=A0A066ZAD6_9ACTN|nr:hypothetical protein KCH_09780 [Kitasatospora cheerisanensis KCTC 2395]